MKNLALDYFRKQPSYCLMVAPKVRDMVTRLWLEGNGLRTVAETILKSDLGKQSIIRYKQYVANVTAVTEDFINSDEKTPAQSLWAFSRTSRKSITSLNTNATA